MNIGDLFDSPLKIAIIAVVIVVLFGSKKLPAAARSLGQSMRILKKEVQGLPEDEDEDEDETEPAAPAQAAAAAGPAAAFPQAQLTATPPGQQPQIDALQQQIRNLQQSPEGRMPLMDHIRELRTRVVKMALALAAGMIVGFIFFQPVWAIIQRPICRTVIRGQIGCRALGVNQLALTGPLDSF